jgi:hypothetical protein
VNIAGRIDGDPTVFGPVHGGVAVSLERER